MKSQRLSELNWIRGISAIFIVLYHYTCRYSESIEITATEYSFKVPWGAGAVNVFFVLSAFLTLYVLNEKRGWLNFLWKRAKRLYPSYWIAIIITSVCTALFLKEKSSSISTILVNFTMLQQYLGFNNVDGVYWTLIFELHFYVYIALLLLIFKTKTKKVLRFMVPALAALGLVVVLLKDRGISNIALSGLNFLLLQKNLAPFTAGMALYFISENKTDIFGWAGLALSLILSYYAQATDYFAFLCIVSAFIICILLLRSGKVREKYINFVEKADKSFLKPLTWIAGISYPLYLLHQYVGFSVIYNFEKIGITSEIIILVPIAVCVLLAFGVEKLTKIIMKPFGKKE